MVRSNTVSMKVSLTLGSCLYSRPTSVYICHISFTSLSYVTTFPMFAFMVPRLALKDAVICLISLKISLILCVLLIYYICLNFSCGLISCSSLKGHICSTAKCVNSAKGVNAAKCVKKLR